MVGKVLHSSTIPSLSVNELVINDPKVIVSKFSDFFANVGPNSTSFWYDFYI